jgi:hypothetical protein
MSTCNDVVGHQHFREACYLLLQGRYEQKLDADALYQNGGKTGKKGHKKTGRAEPLTRERKESNICYNRKQKILFSGPVC